jgi:Zn-dependent protease with chaperone function
MTSTTNDYLTKNNIMFKEELVTLALGIVAFSAVKSLLSVLLRIRGISKMQDELDRYGKLDKNMSDKVAKLVNDDTVRVYSIKDKEYNAFNFGNSSLVYSSGLASGITEEELTAVLLHEYGHYINKDSIKQNIVMGISEFFRLNIVINLCIAVGINTIEAMHGRIVGITFITYLLGNELGAAFLKIFENMFFNRRHEYRADKFSKNLGYGKQLASALTKIENKIKELHCKNLTVEQCNILLKPSVLDEHPETRKRIKVLISGLLKMPPRKLLNIVSSKEFIPEEEV